MAHARAASRLRADAERLADIFTVLQRCFLLRLSKDLGKGNVSCAQALPKDLGDWRGTVEFVLEIGRAHV